MPAGPHKYGRDKKKCERYASTGIREKNKARRLAKRLIKLAKAKIRRELKLGVV